MDVGNTVDVVDSDTLTWTERRTCRCCGSSIPFSERKAIDQIHPGLDVCIDCMPHMFEKNCIDEHL